MTLWFPHGSVGAAKGGAPPPAGSLTLEQSASVTSSAGTTTRTFTVNIPSSLTNSMILWGMNWFQNTSTITNMTFDGSATGVVQVGSTLAADEAGNRDGLWMGYLLAPGSGDRDIQATFDESQASDSDGLMYWILSGANQTTPIDAFTTPTDRGNITGSDYDETLTTSVANCGNFVFAIDFQLEAAGSITGYTAISPRPDFNDALANLNLGAAGNKDFTYVSSGNGSDMTLGHMAVRPA